MKEIIDYETFIKEYQANAINHKDGLMEGDHRKTNKSYGKLKSMFEYLQTHDEFSDHVLQLLLKDEDVKVSSSAAVHSLGLQKFIPEAKRILRDTAENKELDFFLRHNAKMTLEIWERQGFLKF